MYYCEVNSKGITVYDTYTFLINKINDINKMAGPHLFGLSAIFNLYRK